MPIASRRHFLELTGLGVASLAASDCRSRKTPQETHLRPVVPVSGRSVVALAHGGDRAKNILDALLAIEDQILPVLKTKNRVVLKPNLVSMTNPLAITQTDALRGVLEFLGPRFNGPIVIAESSTRNTIEGFANFGYEKLAAEHRSQQVSLLDLNTEGRFEMIGILDREIHVTPIRLAARLLDPEAFIVSVAPMKTHNSVVATMAVKNMAMGAPLRSAPAATEEWNDKRLYHAGARLIHYNILLTAQKLRATWSLGVIDGYDGMEGNGPHRGVAVPHRVAIASTDLIAADRVGVEVMGIDASWLGYLRYCHQFGLGQYDLDKIDIRGARIAEVRRKYRLHDRIDDMLRWMGPPNQDPLKFVQLDLERLQPYRV
jgi:uncharacterized protein (DUF362 family)